LSYEDKNERDWVFKGGSFVNLGPGVIEENTATVEAGFLAAPLFGDGSKFTYAREDDKWVLVDLDQLWIS